MLCLQSGVCDAWLSQDALHGMQFRVAASKTTRHLLEVVGKLQGDIPSMCDLVLSVNSVGDGIEDARVE